MKADEVMLSFICTYSVTSTTFVCGAAEVASVDGIRFVV